jgi:hypothetical protein
VNEPIRDVDDALETILAWRSMRVAPTGLRADISAAVGLVPQRRPSRGWRETFSPAVRLVFIGAAIALLGALAVGVAVVGSRPDLRSQLAPTAVPTTGPTGVPAAAPLLWCDPRPLPAGSSSLDLTGAWSDGANQYYLHQTGDTLWGIAINSMEPSYPDSTRIGPYLVFHGSIKGGRTVAIEWAAAGERFPGDTRFGQFADKSGSLIWQISAGSDGNVRLVTTSETGSDLSATAYRLPTLTACTPAVR